VKSSRLVQSPLADDLSACAFLKRIATTNAPHMSVFGGRADMIFCAANVCFWPKAGIDCLRNVLHKLYPPTFLVGGCGRAAIMAINAAVQRRFLHGASALQPPTYLSFCPSPSRRSSKIGNGNRHRYGRGKPHRCSPAVEPICG